MEVVKSRYGLDRSIERVNFEKLMVLGESQFVKTNGRSFDFEGGPYYAEGGRIFFEKMNWRIIAVEPIKKPYPNLHGCVLYVEPIY
jgi:hypothetical protein